jgi:hypothetical protein
MTTIADLTYRVARELGVVLENTADSGSTTTLVDAARSESDDYWIGGPLWILSTTDGAAPQGEMSDVSDFVSSTGTITVSPEFTVAPEDGDYYAIGKRRYPRSILIQKVNQAIKDLGQIEQTDTSVTTAAGQSEYSIPAAVAKDLRRVFEQLSTTSGDTQPKERFDWSIRRSATGTKDVLVFDAPLVGGRTLELRYYDEHAEIRDADSALDDDIPPEVIVYMATLGCLRWRKQRVGTMDQTLPDQMREVQDALDGMHGARARLEAQEITPAPRLFIAGGSYRRYPGDRTPR